MNMGGRATLVRAMICNNGSLNEPLVLWNVEWTIVADMSKLTADMACSLGLSLGVVVALLCQAKMGSVSVVVGVSERRIAVVIIRANGVV